MACKRGGSLFLQSISPSLIRNRNHNTRALSICNGKRTSHPNTASINKMEEAQGIPTEQAKATSTEEVPNENAQVLRIESIESVEKRFVGLLGEIHEIKYNFEKEAGKLEHKFRQTGEADISLLKKEIFDLWARSSFAYFFALTGFIGTLYKLWG